MYDEGLNKVKSFKQFQQLDYPKLDKGNSSVLRR